MANPFEYVKSVSQTKDYLVDDADLVRKEYNPFLVNRTLSNSLHTLFFANEMNCMAYLDKRTQYDFYYYGIPKQNKYIAWSKKESNEDYERDLEAVSDAYGVSSVKAAEMIKLLSSDQLEFIRNMKGGKYG